MRYTKIEILKILILAFSIMSLVMSISLAGDKQIAQTPPMGWNSYNCYGATVTEAEVKANTDMMAVHLKDFGWEYIVIDYCWSYPFVGALNNPPQTKDYKPKLAMDKYGRLLPALDRFPSAANGKGFKPLADYIHSKGLKFGIHVMRGIPRQAVAWKTQILGSHVFASDIVDTSSTCSWLNHMYGVDGSTEGAQEYYNSLIQLYAEWGVDFIKVDDMIAPVYHSWEIEAIRKAIEKSGRKIVLSLSPGNNVPIQHAGHLQQHANMWRISADFWDEWAQLKKQFDICAEWAPFIGPGHWPDADMLQLGRLSRRGPSGFERDSRFTRDEQITHVTLWTIFRSPLMMGGDLSMIYPFALSLLRNKEVLEVNQNSSNNRQLFRRGNHVVWTADIPDSKDKYLALFNLGEDQEIPIFVLLSDLGLKGKCKIRDLWKHQDLGYFSKNFLQLIPPHGAGLYKIIPE